MTFVVHGFPPFFVIMHGALMCASCFDYCEHYRPSERCITKQNKQITAALVIEKVNESSETLMAAVEGVRKFQSDHENMITTLQDEATTTKDLVESNFEANVDRFERAQPLHASLAAVLERKHGKLRRDFICIALHAAAFWDGTRL